MGRKILIIVTIFLGITLLSYSQKTKSKGTKTAPATSKQTEKIQIKIKEAGSDWVWFSLKGKLTDQVMMLGKTIDSTLKAEKIVKFAPTDTVFLSELRKYEGKWLIASVLDTQKRQICIKGLSAKGDYLILLYQKKENVYRLVQAKEFNTFAEEPTRQASKIAYQNNEDGSIYLRWLRGTGEGRIVIGSRKKLKNLPKKGETYKAGSKKLGDTHIFADLEGQESKLLLKDLEPGRWTIQIVEYNGEGKYRNYLLTPGDVNPATVIVPFNPPKLNQPTEITNEGFTISWSAIEDAVAYSIEIAEDESFERKVPDYEELDVGKITEIEIQGLNANTQYYFRVKAKTKDNWSLWSKPQAVKTR